MPFCSEREISSLDSPGSSKTLRFFGPDTHPDHRMTTKKNAPGAADYFPVQRLKISAALVPPKPNEFESA
jgi:hypothetical protein